MSKLWALLRLRRLIVAVVVVLTVASGASWWFKLFIIGIPALFWLRGFMRRNGLSIRGIFRRGARARDY